MASFDALLALMARAQAERNARELGAFQQFGGGLAGLGQGIGRGIFAGGQKQHEATQQAASMQHDDKIRRDNRLFAQEQQVQGQRMRAKEAAEDRAAQAQRDQQMHKFRMEEAKAGRPGIGSSIVEAIGDAAKGISGFAQTAMKERNRMTIEANKQRGRDEDRRQNRELALRRMELTAIKAATDRGDKGAAAQVAKTTSLIRMGNQKIDRIAKQIENLQKRAFTMNSDAVATQMAKLNAELDAAQNEVNTRTVELEGLSGIAYNPDAVDVAAELRAILEE